MRNIYLERIIGSIIFIVVLLFYCSCSKTESYTDLLRDEEKACNWFLSNQRVVAEVPEDSIFEEGPDAPYYRMDADGYIYMQVLNSGSSDKPKSNDIVYFRFMRENIKSLYKNYPVTPDGNMDNLMSVWGNTSFVMNDLSLPSSSAWGSGIQLPLKYLGYDSEVNLVLRSYYGFTDDQVQCNPYLIRIKYFKPIY